MSNKVKFRCPKCFNLPLFTLIPNDNYSETNVIIKCRCGKNELILSEFVEKYNMKKFVCSSCSTPLKINEENNKHLNYLCDKCSKIFCFECQKNTQCLNNNVPHQIINIDFYDFYCRNHKTYKIRAYCKICEKLICEKCEYQTCENHNIINDKNIFTYSKYLENKKLLDKAEEKLTSDIEKLKYDYITYFNELIAKIKKEYSNFFQSNLERIRVLRSLMNYYHQNEASQNYNVPLFVNLLKNSHFDFSVPTLDLEKINVITNNFFNFLEKNSVITQNKIEFKLVKNFPSGDNIIKSLISLNDGRLAISSENRIKIFFPNIFDFQRDLTCLENISTIIQLKDNRIACGTEFGKIFIWNNNISKNSFDNKINAHNGIIHQIIQMNCNFNKNNINNNDNDNNNNNNNNDHINNNIINKIINNIINNNNNKNNNSYIVSCGTDKLIKFFEIHEPFNCVKILEDHNDIITCIINFNENLLISSELGGIFFWELNEYKNMKQLYNKEFIVYQFEKINNKNLLINFIKKISLFDINNYQFITNINTNDKFAPFLKFNQKILIVNSFNEFSVKTLKTLKEISKTNKIDEKSVLEFEKIIKIDNKYIACTKNEKVYIYEINFNLWS